MRAIMYRSSKKSAERNAGRQGETLCRNPHHVHIVPYFLYRQLGISMAVHSVVQRK